MNIQINIPAWHAHEYLNAIRVLQALLRDEPGSATIAIEAIKAEIAGQHPNWTKSLLEHTEAVIAKLENI